MEWNGSVQPNYPRNLLEQLPTQLNAQWNCLPPFQPYYFTLRSILWFVRFFIFGGLVVWRLDLESVQSQQKESGRSNWAAGGEKVDAQPMLDDGGEGCFLLRFYSILFLQKSPRNRFSWNVNSSRFPVEYTRCHILYSPPIYESKFGVPTSDFTPQKQTITKHVHIHSWNLHGWFAVNGQWYILFFIHWNGSVQPISYPDNFHPCSSTTSGLELLPPNSAVPTLPLQSEKHHLAWWRTWSGVGPGVKIQIRRIVNHYNQIAMVLASKRSWKKSEVRMMHVLIYIYIIYIYIFYTCHNLSIWSRLAVARTQWMNCRYVYIWKNTYSHVVWGLVGSEYKNLKYLKVTYDSRSVSQWGCSSSLVLRNVLLL